MLNIKRSAVSVLMCAGIALMIPLVSLLPAKDKNLSAATESVSGIVTQEKSVSQLKKLYKNIKTYSKLFDTEGSAKSPYKTYTLTKDAKQSALDWINYYRYAARVPSITFDDKLNTDAAYGALLDAAYGALSHNPFLSDGSYHKPSDMSQSMFDRGEYATQTSNLSVLWSSGDMQTYVIKYAVPGQMADSSELNIPTVGHRRWLLNPYVQTMGIGSAYAKDSNDYNNYYTDIRVFSSSNNPFYDSSYGKNQTTSDPGDFSFISWPASGYNLSETFSPEDPWSVSLNMNKYSAPDASDMTVKVTRMSDNKTCTITGAAFSSHEKKYLIDSNGWYGGIYNCFIFSPGTDFLGTEVLKGQYKVSVSGLKDASGKSVTLDYTVNFTSVNDKDPTATPTPTGKPSATPTPKSSSGSASGTKITMKLQGTIVVGKSSKAQVTVSPSGKTVTYTSSDSKIATVDSSGNVKGIMAGKATITAKTSDGAKASIAVQILYKDVTDSKDFWYEPTYYLTNKNIVKGYDKQTNFKSANECTRAQMVTFLWRLSGEPAPNSSTCKFKDVEKSDYFYKAVIWAVEKGITTGTSKTAFSPSKVCTRAQTVTFLWRMAGKPAVGSAKNPFSDVEKGDYYHDAVIWASAKKIVAGYDDGTFKPQGKCLRRQMVTFLYKYDKNVK